MVPVNLAWVLWGWPNLFLQRMRENVPTGYDEAALDAFAKRARRWQKAGRDAYMFLINGAKTRAPAAALALQSKLLININ